jgi:hypothetical protein
MQHSRSKLENTYIHTYLPSCTTLITYKNSKHHVPRSYLTSSNYSSKSSNADRATRAMDQPQSPVPFRSVPAPVTPLIQAKRQLVEHGANVDAVSIPQGKAGDVTSLDFVEFFLGAGAAPNAHDHSHLGLTLLMSTTKLVPGAANFILRGRISTTEILVHLHNYTYGYRYECDKIFSLHFLALN